MSSFPPASGPDDCADATPWEFVQDDTDATMGTARVLNARNELVCTATPENADLIVCAANYLAVATPRKDEMNEPHVCHPEQTDERTATCPVCHAVYVRDEDATADERSYADAR